MRSTRSVGSGVGKDEVDEEDRRRREEQRSKVRILHMINFKTIKQRCVLSKLSCPYIAADRKLRNDYETYCPIVRTFLPAWSRLIFDSGRNRADCMRSVGGDGAGTATG